MGSTFHTIKCSIHVTDGRFRFTEKVGFMGECDKDFTGLFRPGF